MKKLFDLLFASTLLVILVIPMLFVIVAVRLTSKGPLIYWSERVGRNNIVFKMPKFRSMRVDTPALATHLLKNPDAYLSSIGGFLRRTSLDEIPQLFSVLKGDMSFVGPRPALFNQDDLIALRTEKGVHALVPGLTGWAQINGRNSIGWNEKFEMDIWYVENQSFTLDIRILFLTLIKVIKRDGISHNKHATMEKFRGNLDDKEIP